MEPSTTPPWRVLEAPSADDPPRASTPPTSPTAISGSIPLAAKVGAIIAAAVACAIVAVLVAVSGGAGSVVVDGGSPIRVDGSCLHRSELLPHRVVVSSSSRSSARSRSPGCISLPPGSRLVDLAAAGGRLWAAGRHGACRAGAEPGGAREGRRPHPRAVAGRRTAIVIRCAHRRFWRSTTRSARRHQHGDADAARGAAGRGAGHSPEDHHGTGGSAVRRGRGVALARRPR